eukprot:2943846-Rhodomonas_salina.1
MSCRAISRRQSCFIRVQIIGTRFRGHYDHVSSRAVLTAKAGAGWLCWDCVLVPLRAKGRVLPLCAKGRGLPLHAKGRGRTTWRGTTRAAAAPASARASSGRTRAEAGEIQTRGWVFQSRRHSWAMRHTQAEKSNAGSKRLWEKSGPRE